MQIKSFLLLTLLTGCRSVSRKLAKSTKSPTSTPAKASTKAPKSTKATSDVSVVDETVALYGLQDECHQDNPDEFNICLNLLGESGEYEDWMEDAIPAKSRWEGAIVKDTVEAFNLTSLYLGIELEIFLEISEGLVPDLVDDLYILVKEVSHFPSGFLAISAQHVIANSMNTEWGDPRNVAYTMSGGIFFSKEAVDAYGVDVETVLLHEIGHILGFGSSVFANMVEIDSEEGFYYHYVGTEGLAQWYKLGCSGKLPLEVFGMDFLEDCLANELMSDSLSSEENPLSAITLGTLADLGYVIDFGEADDFTIDDLGTCDIDFCDISRRKLVPAATTARPPLSESSWYDIYTVVLDMTAEEVVFVEYVQEGFLYSVRVEREDAIEFLKTFRRDEDSD